LISAPATINSGFCAIALALALLPLGAVAENDDMRGLDTETPEGITVVHRNDGIVFGDADGLTLYTFDEDAETPGESSCYTERHCERRWPPLRAPSRAAALGKWSVTERRDGSLQWVYKGSPVYRSSEDVTPGVMSGDNARQTWHAIFQPYSAPEPAVPPGIAVKRDGNDWVFADQQDRLLYFPEAHEDNGLGCVAKCLYEWLPLPVPALARPVGDWSIAIRPDGSRQWLHADRPAYFPRQPLGVFGRAGETAASVPGWSRLAVTQAAMN